MLVRRSFAAFVALVLLAPAVRAADEPFPIKVALVAGVGTAYDLLGAHVELRVSHVALFAGTGAMAFVPALFVGPTGSGAYSPHFGGCGGIRYYGGEGDGFFGSLNLTYGTFEGHYDPTVQQSQAVSGSLLTGTGTLGWRWRSNHLLYELGLGLGMYRKDSPPAGYTGMPPPGVGNTLSTGLIPDASFAVGLEF
jgi:hypothetical protein